MSGSTINVDPVSLATIVAGDISVVRAAASIAVTDDQIFTTVMAFLAEITGVEVVRGQANRVAEPNDDTYIVVIPGLRTGLGMPIVTYYDAVAKNGTGLSVKMSCQPMRIDFQIDAHGEGSADLATIVRTVMRDFYACRYFKESGLPVQPLFASEPRQMPFTNEGGQEEDRWTLDASFQANVVVSIQQQFAGTLTINTIPVH